MVRSRVELSSSSRKATRPAWATRPDPANRTFVVRVVLLGAVLACAPRYRPPGWSVDGLEHQVEQFHVRHGSSGRMLTRCHVHLQGSFVELGVSDTYASLLYDVV